MLVLVFFLLQIFRRSKIFNRSEILKQNLSQTEQKEENKKMRHPAVPLWKEQTEVRSIVKGVLRIIGFRQKCVPYHKFFLKNIYEGIKFYKT